MLGKRKGLGRVGDHIVHASWRGTRWWSSWQRTLVNRRALLLSWCALLFSFVPGIPSVLRQTADHAQSQPRKATSHRWAIRTHFSRFSGLKFTEAFSHGSIFFTRQSEISKGQHMADAIDVES
ncbi:hypothetical protein AB1N83_009224 [Pleurotus pulmonarius]